MIQRKKKRKSPIRHKVKSHVRSIVRVQNYMRGKGSRKRRRKKSFLVKSVLASVNKPMGVYYHGTTFKAKQNILEYGIQPDELQKRDYGFFGKGFYVTKKRTSAKMYGPSIIKLRTKKGARMLEIPQAQDGSWIPDKNPEWQHKFENWIIAKIKVNPELTVEKKRNIIPIVLRKVRPESDDFEKFVWKGYVQDYASENYDIVDFAGGSEVVVMNPDAIKVVKLK